MRIISIVKVLFVELFVYAAFSFSLKGYLLFSSKHNSFSAQFHTNVYH